MPIELEEPRAIAPDDGMARILDDVRLLPGAGGGVVRPYPAR